MYIVRKYSLSNAAILRNWIDRSEITEPNKKKKQPIDKIKALLSQFILTLSQIILHINSKRSTLFSTKRTALITEKLRKIKN
ncbi:MAG: hypothetical protein WC679_03065 [Bacteroidales bacterium]|jgi:hypothetical protein